MTKLLQEAFDQAAKLPPDEQDAVAARLLAELEDERRWDDALDHPQEQLAKLAARVRDDLRQGRAKEAGIDEL